MQASDLSMKDTHRPEYMDCCLLVMCYGDDLVFQGHLVAIPQFARLGPLFKSSKKAVELCLSYV